MNNPRGRRRAMKVVIKQHAMSESGIEINVVGDMSVSLVVNGRTIPADHAVEAFLAFPGVDAEADEYWGEVTELDAMLSKARAEMAMMEAEIARLKDLVKNKKGD
jgi:hypothetical protein